MAVVKLADGRYMASHNGQKQYFTSQSAAMKAYDQMKSGGSTKSSSSSTSIKNTTSSAPSTNSTSSSSKTSASIPSTVLAAQDLSAYYAALGKNLPSYSSRFSDPAFAAAAQRAGVSQGSYTGSTSQNTAILNQLKTGQPQQTPASTTGTPAVSTPSKTGTPSTSGSTPSGSDYSGTSSGGGSAYPMGNFSLVRFQGQGPSGYMNDQTIWLLDPSTKTLRPFSGGAALSNFFDGDVDLDQVVVLSAQDLMPGGTLGSQGGSPGYQVLSNEYAIQKDGSARRLDYSAAQLATRYGQPVNEEMEQTMFSALKGVFNMLETAGIDKGAINKIKNNDELMAFYVSSMAYGGYSVGDIYSDVKKRELGLNNVSPISATADKSSYARTADYQKASADTRLTPPVEMAGMNSAQLDLPVYQLPDEAFKTLVPILDYNSQEFKDAMSSVETSYYDLLEQQLRATTEQEKAIADYNYQEWKNDVQRNFGIALSDNALEAWNQIQQVYNQGAQNGTFNSGIQNESIDSYLRQVRRQDQRVRDEKLTNEERQQMNYYLTAATSAQIKELIDSDPEKAQRWGLIPSDEVKNALSLTALKQKYPNAKEEDLAQYISILLDENGNYRSQIYQKQMGTLGDLDPNSASMNTLTGIGTGKEQFQYSEALRKELLKEEEAYKEFTTPDVAFLRNSDPQAFESVAGLKTSSGKKDNLTSTIKQAGSYLKTGAKPSVPTSTSSTGSSSNASTTSTKASLQAQIDSAKKMLADIQSRSSTPATGTKFSTSSVSSTPTVTTPKQTTSQYSSPIGPTQAPKATQSYMPSSSTGSTANSTPSSSSSTSGGTIKNLLSKLKFW